MKKRRSLIGLAGSLAAIVLIAHFCTLPAAGQIVIGNMTITAGESSGEQGLSKTGQETSYETGDDADHADPTGDDVGYTKGEGSWANWNADGGRFTASTLSGDDVVIDNATGLMWAADSNEEGCSYGALETWSDALDWAEALDFAGYTDWRLPNIRELQSIVDYGTNAPSIDTNFFTNIQVNAGYWSSTTLDSDTTDVWYVRFGIGNITYCDKAPTGYVRAVRDND